jgi:hypothetical protein
LRGGTENDVLFGENGMDMLWGGAGNDFVDGSNGKDICHGELGDDQLKGGRGRDSLDGDAGDNIIDGDGGVNDIVNGVEYDLDGEFQADLSGANGETGRARYDVQNNGGQVRTNFDVRVQNGPANSTLDIIIDGITIGQVSTNGTGNGEVKFSTDPNGPELPLPVNFPTLANGSIILVGNVLDGVFAPKHVIA